MYELYIYDELCETFNTERGAYSFIRDMFSELIDEMREEEKLADATDEYIISILVDPSTDGLALIKRG